MAAIWRGVSELRQPVVFSEPVLFEVEKGDSLKKVAHQLEDRGVIRSAFWFYWYGRYQSFDRQLKAGEYWLPANISAAEFYPILTSGRTARYSIQFIEGWTLSQIVAELDNHPKLNRKIDTKDPEEIAKLLGMERSHAEGMIFPDTYSYRKGTSDVEVLERAHQKMLTTLAEIWQVRSKYAEVENPYEALILASIIEKETGVAGERRLISGVFTSRLKKQMRLQTDPTVIYGLGELYEGNLTRAHLRQVTPYNTYVIRGLPPTPIAIPGRASIEAAVFPDIRGYLYFVAKGDGSHQFSKNLRDHNRAVRQYQLKRRKDYRSSQ